jgi:hypothetical protein
LSDIQAFLQWDFVNQEDCKVGFEIFGSAPAGNRPEGCFLFEPIVGNGKHWELGAGLNGYLTLWESQKCNRVGGFFGQLLVSHLFKADQRRSFDFINNGPGSRYMLLEEIRTLVCGLQIPAGVTPPNQYQGVLVTAINKTTLPCSISVPAQVDLLLKLNMRAGGFDAEVGYNLWFRMAERLNCRKRFKENKYGVKGDAQIYGFALPNPPGSPVPLNATQHNATLHAGQGVGNASFTNANADNAANAFDTVSGNLDNLTAADAIASGVGLADANSSNPAILLTDSDIDNCSALSPKAISHKFFVHAGYAGKELNNCWIPYFGIGAEAEISCFCFTTNSAVSQWGVWIKGGLSY